MYQKQVKAYKSILNTIFASFFDTPSSTSPNPKIITFKRIDFYRKMRMFFYKNTGAKNVFHEHKTIIL